MWNDAKSVVLSLVSTWIAIVAVIAFAVWLPVAPKWFPYQESILFRTETLAIVLPSLYGCCAAALVALICLHGLLKSIQAGEIFTLANVRRLRTISWCSFAIAGILVATCIFRIWTPAMILIALAAGFFFLLMRVMKNIIDAARLIKDENDYTI
ncbi:MAG: DUF2975 domain-containing protein [Clostridiales Family XIII bacterium]|jgi:hypothetical protein|nr:DUF2975 domain-containing protein [Clostridiales Family XIII bacterium]